MTMDPRVKGEMGVASLTEKQDRISKATMQKTTGIFKAMEYYYTTVSTHIIL